MSHEGRFCLTHFCFCGESPGTVLFVPFVISKMRIIGDESEDESPGTVLKNSFSMENEFFRTVPRDSLSRQDSQNRPLRPII